MENKEFFDKIDAELKKLVDKDRYEHSIRVAKTAKLMCKRYGENSDAGYLAGLSHDICKQFSDKDLQDLAKKDGLPISLIEKEKPSLLHGRAAAIFLEERFFSDPFLRENLALLEEKDVIIEAVRWHTFGKENLSNLAKIVYLADKIEPGRRYKIKSLLSEIDSLSLDELGLKVLQDAIAYLKKKKKDISLYTLRFYEEMLSDTLVE